MALYRRQDSIELPREQVPSTPSALVAAVPLAQELILADGHCGRGLAGVCMAPWSRRVRSSGSGFPCHSPPGWKSVGGSNLTGW